MKILPHAQGSLEWQIARAGIPTASEFGNLVTPKFEIRKGEMLRTYLAAKLAEAWLGGPLIGFNTFDMDQGRILEEEARPWLELATEMSVQPVGLITTDDGRVGCSPDGIVMEPAGTFGVEIKCPQPTAHVKYLMSGKVPDEYLPQIHGGMYVTGFKEWKFLSYRRNFPKLLLTVERDEEIIEAIGEALTEFQMQFEIGMKILIEANGGPPKRRAPTPKAETVESGFDLMP